MAERKSGEADRQSLAARRALTVTAWFFIVLATLAGCGAWAEVALGLHRRPSPGRRVESKAFDGNCYGIAVIEDEAVWLHCGGGMLRIDTEKATAKDWALDEENNRTEHVWRGFLPNGDGPVVLTGDMLVRLRPDGSVQKIATDARLTEAIGLWVGKDSVEAIAPSSRGSTHSVDFVRYSATETRSRHIAWMLDPARPEQEALSAISARKTNQWRILYSSSLDPIYSSDGSVDSPLSLFEAEPRRRKNATYAYMDTPSWIFPPELSRRVEYRLSIIRLGKEGVVDWDFGGENFGRADLQVTPDGLLPLLEVNDEQSQFIRHGRKFHLARDVSSQLLVAWDGVAQPVASEWPNARTIVVPRKDGGLAFVSARGRVAHVNADLERTDRIHPLERITTALRAEKKPSWRPWFLLFTWPVAAACALLIASLARRRRVYVIGMAGALWFIVALVAFDSQFFVFASTL